MLKWKLCSGANCEVNIDECAKQPCMHDGECTDLVNDYKCTCDVFYTGKRCQHMIDDCASHPCQNGGSCVDMEGGFTCNCRPGFVGTFLFYSSSNPKRFLNNFLVFVT